MPLSPLWQPAEPKRDPRRPRYALVRKLRPDRTKHAGRHQGRSVHGRTGTPPVIRLRRDRLHPAPSRRARTPRDTRPHCDPQRVQTDRRRPPLRSRGNVAPNAAGCTLPGCTTAACVAATTHRLRYAAPPSLAATARLLYLPLPARGIRSRSLRATERRAVRIAATTAHGPWHRGFRIESQLGLRPCARVVARSIPLVNSRHHRARRQPTRCVSPPLTARPRGGIPGVVGSGTRPRARRFGGALVAVGLVAFGPPLAASNPSLVSTAKF